MDKIIGKYKVIDYTKPSQPNFILTDNPREAVWEANRRPTREIVNICGEREFYIGDDGKYHMVSNEKD